MEASLMGIHLEGCLTFAWIERKTPALQSNQSFLGSLHRSRKEDSGGKDLMARL